MRTNLPPELAKKYAKEIARAKRGGFWYSPMTKKKLSPITKEEVAEVLKRMGV